MVISIAQLNLGRGRLAAVELRERAVRGRIDVLLLQEPYMDRHGRIPGFGLGSRVVVGVREEEERPWAAIVILSPEVEAFRLSGVSDAHCVVAQLVKGETSFYVVSMYCQESHGIEEYLERLRRVGGLLRGADLIIGMDSNARSPVWGDRIRNEKGELMEAFIEETGLRLLNDGAVPTFNSGRGESFIDLTLASAGLVERVKNWTVEEEWTTSFHGTIRMRIERGARVRGRVRREYAGFCLGSADWEVFREELQRTRRPLLEYGIGGRCAVARYEGMVTKWVLGAAVKSMKRGVRRARVVRWWSEELEGLKKSVAKLRRGIRRGRTEEELRLVYRRGRNLYKKRVKEVKKRSWETFVTEEMDRGPWNFLYKLAVGKVKVEKVMDLIGEEEGVRD